MRNAYHKTLTTGNFHTKDEKELVYETLDEYKKRTTKTALSTVTHEVVD